MKQFRYWSRVSSAASSGMPLRLRAVKAKSLTLKQSQRTDVRVKDSGRLDQSCERCVTTMELRYTVGTRSPSENTGETTCFSKAVKNPMHLISKALQTGPSFVS